MVVLARFVGAGEGEAEMLPAFGKFFSLGFFGDAEVVDPEDAPRWRFSNAPGEEYAAVGKRCRMNSGTGRTSSVSAPGKCDRFGAVEGIWRRKWLSLRQCQANRRRGSRPCAYAADDFLLEDFAVAKLFGCVVQAGHRRV